MCSKAEHFGLQIIKTLCIQTAGMQSGLSPGQVTWNPWHLKPDIWHLKNKCMLHIVYCMLNVHITYGVILEQPLLIIRSDCSRTHCLHGMDNTHSRSTHQVSQHKWHECMRKLLFCQGFWISRVFSWSRAGMRSSYCYYLNVRPEPKWTHWGPESVRGVSVTCNEVQWLAVDFKCQWSSLQPTSM